MAVSQTLRLLLIITVITTSASRDYCGYEPEIYTRIKVAFIIGDTLYLGNRTHFLQTKFAATDQNLYLDTVDDISTVFPGLLMTSVESVLYFGTEDECRQTHTDCKIMTKAFDKSMIFGYAKNQLGEQYLEYRTYVTKNGAITPVTSGEDMPWGLAPDSMAFPSAFWPRDRPYRYERFAFDANSRRLYVTTTRTEVFGVTESELHYRVIDERMDTNYTTVTVSRDYNSILAKDHNLFGLHNGSWFLLQITADKAIESKIYTMKEFVNCGKDSPLLAKTSILDALIANGSSVTDEPTLATHVMLDETTSLSPQTSDSNSGSSFWIILILGIIIIALIAAIIWSVMMWIKSQVGPNEESTSGRNDPDSKIVSETADRPHAKTEGSKGKQMPKSESSKTERSLSLKSPRSTLGK